ncbi:MAG: signal peptide peptidase SppA [Aliidiomarina sp.]|uniref:signal peptide peptidase SppA n=1 Tax=Aliidiomarina sp. TaxID=1872439 RepID=UPI0025C6E0D0|nr:signal peptide peptidase SppA [Aliidiomarina sp.]MCH8500313.1 signal peptide peptidase SppA [Aliidiomarina sp.]
MKFLARILRPIWNFINTVRRIILNFIFFVLVIIIGVALFSGDKEPTVPDGGLLVLNPFGILVEEASYLSPSDRFLAEALGNSPIPETSLHDFLAVIEHAANDDRVAGVVLDLRYFWGGGISKMEKVAEQLELVRAAGKPIIAHGNSFGQSQYFLASQADTIYLNPQGAVSVEGFHAYQTYFKGLFDKLHVKPYIFRVGDFKSAVEPYSRMDMSEEAKEANQEWIDGQWQLYLAGITRHRDIAPELLSGQMDDYLRLFAAADNSQAQMALDAGLVDELAHAEAIRNALIEIGGANDNGNGNSYRHITWRDYMRVIDRENVIKKPDTRPEVRVVFAAGTILDGRQPRGTVGGESLSAELRRARLDDNVKAVVLRIDSPGGSAFASEQIRQEVLQLREAGKPVVASMSSVAASGGYWIAAGADEIYATPATITGSIGVFGMFLSLQETLAQVGVYTDGVSSTEFPYISIERDLNDAAQEAIQRGVDRIYDEFLSLVAEARNMTVAEVHEVAQGRVWTGSRALELGLVDALGELEDAVIAVAARAELEDYQVTFPTVELTGMEALLAQIFDTSVKFAPNLFKTKSPTLLEQKVLELRREVEALNEFNDPNYIYARCLECKVY